MRKITLIMLAVCLIFCSCSRTDNSLTTNINETKTENKTSDYSDINDNSSEITSAVNEQDTTEAETISKPALSGASRCFYGEKSKSASTYTGLLPLPANKFEDVRLSDSNKFSEKTIEHSYGAAKDEQVNNISKQCQEFFDDNNFDAVCYDNKSNEKVLYLTFDCGYENGYTSLILDTLRDKNVTAAFFCTLPQIKQEPELIARMIKEGHIVGNHSVTHPDFSKLSRKEMFDELSVFDEYLRQNFGYSSLYFRYPQGKYNEKSLDLINSMGYMCVFWSVAYVDWELDNQKGESYAVQTVTSRIHPGGVILLHSVSPDNAHALGKIIDNAKSMGYVFKSLNDLNNN